MAIRLLPLTVSATANDASTYLLIVVQQHHNFALAFRQILRGFEFHLFRTNPGDIHDAPIPPLPFSLTFHFQQVDVQFI
jgi:hypothetical protein